MSNSALPDTAASYWLEPFTIHKDTRIILSGTYPDARYASFSVYTSSGVAFTSNGVGSSLADYQIAPDSGSLNPWQKTAAAEDGGARVTSASPFVRTYPPAR